MGGNHEKTSSPFSNCVRPVGNNPRALGAVRADAREEGPTEIEKCQTIDKPGSYKLINNLTISALASNCLLITADSVTIDLAGFTISGPGTNNAAAGIVTGPDTFGIAVRNGSIRGFGDTGVRLGGDASIVEGLRVVSFFSPAAFGIVATGLVKGNTVLDIEGLGGSGIGISATGILTGNYIFGSQVAQYEIGQSSTVIGNTAVGGPIPDVRDLRCLAPLT